jgi:nicotinate-nucleotide adenylyltransferase
MISDVSTLLFGGTFDPPHVAHKEIVKILITTFPLAKVAIVPAASPPRHTQAIKFPTASFEQRLEMIHLSLGDLVPQTYFIDPIESTLPTPNYTYQTLNHYYETQKNLNPAIVIGLDQFFAFHLWAKADYILSRAHIIVINRMTQPISYFESIVERLCLKFQLKIEKAQERYYCQKDSEFCIQMLEDSVTRCESETIRENLVKNDLDPIRAFLDPKVLEYIKEHQIYGQ